jgi:DNA-binding beta-propeller fold protein YncE
VDAEGNLYLAQTPTGDNHRYRISVFNAALRVERYIYFEGFEGAEEFIPQRLAMDNRGNIYVAGYYHEGVLVIDREGNLLDTIAPEWKGKRAKLIDVAVDEAGRVYLVSEEAGQIFVYDENREFLFSFGQKGGASGMLSRPRALGVDIRSGRIYVVDYMRHAVSAYDYDDGRYLFEFGGRGWGEGWFQHPRDIDVDESGRILVADTFNNRVQVFKPKERKIAEHLKQLFGERWKERRASSPEERRASSPPEEQRASSPEDRRASSPEDQRASSPEDQRAASPEEEETIGKGRSLTSLYTRNP